MIANGKHVYLRSMDHNDLYRGMDWLNDSEITKWMQKPQPQTYKKMLDYYDGMSDPNMYLAICTHDMYTPKGIHASRHIGNISYKDHLLEGYHSDVSIVIGDKEQWGKGYATEAITLLSDCIFHKLRAGACVENMGCIKAFTKAGFIIEGMEKESVYCDGEWRDIAVMGLLKSDWEALR
jgi:ribosomal-protein-alanine N-acetyltransferase